MSTIISLRNPGSSSFRKLCMLLLASLAVLALLFFYLDIILQLKPRSLWRIGEGNSTPAFLGVADRIYVVSLPTRQARREDMERVRLALGLDWTYIDALPSTDPLTGRIMTWVKAIRTWPRRDFNDSEENLDPPLLPTTVNFSWPEDIGRLVESTREIDLWPDTWTSLGFPITSSYQPIACATKDYNITDGLTALPEHLILTPARVACWHSHLSVIHKWANTPVSDASGVAIILEDDIDMERDIHQQLRHLWSSLPAQWDIVFLGHCWSDESKHPPLSESPQMSMSPETVHRQPSFSGSRLYTSVSPKCTHAYALSRNGARRLLLHLRYPPFAYSRAIDQAIAWLVESGRLRSFSIVPSLVIQRKVAVSDVMLGKGTGSKWKDSLTNGMFSDLDGSKLL